MSSDENTDRMNWKDKLIHSDETVLDCKVSISERYQANTTFQSVRENCQTCVEALSNWDNIEFGETVIRRKEYGELNQSL